MRHSLKLFVYGTLKRGFSNHERYCTGVSGIEPAAVRGRLYRLMPGIPIMAVPREDIIAAGTSDPLADVAVQAEFCARMTSTGEFSRRFVLPASGIDHAGSDARPRSPGFERPEWLLVRGELLTFEDPEARLPLIDSLEEFTPHAPSTYIRVLIPVLVGSAPCTAAWAYVARFGTEGLDPFEGGWWEG
jgi:gamma-glutamylcyclotransferase (GGCT)/AIG2-like uncharacterized protein YtfP